VAFVCTGNRFRSPLAAGLLAAEAQGIPLHVASLGTLELGPVPALPEALEIARAMGVDLSSHRARSVAQTDLEAFELVLGFERAHVAAAVVDAGAHLETTFTLPELVDLLEAVPDPPPGPRVERARLRIREAHAARPAERNRRVPELADPLGRSLRTQREIADQLRALVSTLTQRLFA
jgi:low molecular weight protein-tyrosine phosphatase